MREGTAATKMYFIHEGIVEVLVVNGQEVVATLSDGCYFGETCLWASGARRPVSVRAETYCNLFSLSATAFARVMDRYPKFKDHVTTVLIDRANRMANIGKRLATDNVQQ
uniref:Potassium/sodium hyperpolarization-activated cyclic nucleotide-gated channel 2 n=1 Tax=Sipha flava TaxID=143950 RepID=A0A2S2R8W3_9HEMI